MYEYLASVQSAVRRINQRMQTLSKNFGKNSGIVNEYKAQIDVLLPDNYYYKDGIMQISKPSEIYNDFEKMSSLENLESKVKTYSRIMKSYEEPYKQYVEEQKFFGVSEELIPKMGEYVKVMESLTDALMQLDSEQLPDKALEILHTKERRKTYQELNDVAEMLKEKGLM